jgi:two-component sensor histidine kinase
MTTAPGAGLSNKSARSSPLAFRAIEDMLPAGLGTGVKMFLVLMLALLPLGILAVVGTVQTIRAAEIERAAWLRLATVQGASHLLWTLNTHRSALRVVANAYEDDRRRPELCRWAANQLVANGQSVAFALIDENDQRLCGRGDLPPAVVGRGSITLDQVASTLPEMQRLLIRINSSDGTIRAAATYTPAQLVDMVDFGSGGGSYFSMRLVLKQDVLVLSERGRRPDPGRLDRSSAPLNLGSINLVVETAKPEFTLMRAAATMLPIFMWVAAAGIGWWVINRFLVHPLVVLNRQVAGYEPGTLLDPVVPESRFVHEIGMLGDTFREISEDVVEHEAQLAEALIHQRALTREVHHRVKNNLQIIASLINLHSASATTPEAGAAYASIQRRVDALSVVHRNHYATAEFSHGIDAQALLSELGSALRASAGDRNGSFAMRVDCDNVYLSQDVAVPAAFLVTELVELVILSARAGQVSIILRREPAGDAARLSVVSEALRSSPAVDALLADRFGRVLTGLSRQLRAQLVHDGEAGSYSIRIPVRTFDVGR